MARKRKQNRYTVEVARRLAQKRRGETRNLARAPLAVTADAGRSKPAKSAKRILKPIEKAGPILKPIEKAGQILKPIEKARPALKPIEKGALNQVVSNVLQQAADLGRPFVVIVMLGGANQADGVLSDVASARDAAEASK